MMSNKTFLGALLGVVIAVALLQWGLSGLLLIVLLAAIGGLAGAQLEGRIDLNKGLEGFRNGGRG
ncbi:hypothetical protein [Corynebacterium pelargi]|uniref:Uncharacterized protein n=1 Tax=Corynebacterium pelargi TaxID=1471400 RepID=A0A410WB56_9CORY|nr:hypothetical protein [Corynebacterium pelargi]QAU53166.1 hypothetical protein CPELA_09555 [Corynebacterium pelargi]GGG74419.1 hypothetical protein GCM10007338_09700 [Corynebacterium pelargi]